MVFKVVHLGKPRRRVYIQHFTVAKEAVFLLWVKAIIQVEVIPYKVKHFVTLLLEFVHHFTVTNPVVLKILLLRNPKIPRKKVSNAYSGTPPYDHPVYKTTSLLRPYSFKPNLKTIESFYYFDDPVNATTSLLRPGFYGPTVVALTGFHCNEKRLYKKRQYKYFPLL